MVSRQLLSFLRQAHCFLSWEWRNNWHFLQTQDVTLITFLPDSDSMQSQSGCLLFKLDYKFDMNYSEGKIPVSACSLVKLC